MHRTIDETVANYWAENLHLPPPLFPPRGFKFTESQIIATHNNGNA